MALPSSSVVIRGEHLADRTQMDDLVVSDVSSANSTLGVELTSLRSANSTLSGAVAAQQVLDAARDLAARNALSSSVAAQQVLDLARENASISTAAATLSGTVLACS